MEMNRPKLKNIYIEYSDTKSLSSKNLALNDIVVFMAGPTPLYPLAKISWRDLFAEALDSIFDNKKIGNRKIILVCPEPYERDWIYGPDDQIDWENKWLERCDIILFWHETR